MKTLTKERPILFSGPMVRAILDGRKTQTRRVVKLNAELRGRGCTSLDGSWWDPSFGGRLKVPGPDDTSHRLFCPYGVPGDRLWVRETWCPSPDGPIYRATEEDAGALEPDDRFIWKPSIHMSRWASRLTLEVVAVRVERVQEITEEDARAEGCHGWYQPMHPDVGETDGRLPHEEFRDLWNSINAARGFGWDSNPWVWVVEFKRTQ